MRFQGNCIFEELNIMKNLEKRIGFKNRHTDGLPAEKTTMKVLIDDVHGNNAILCEWIPFNKEKYSEWAMPSSGYLGTAKVIEEQYKGIGFHAWEQLDSEFVYYSVVN